MALTIFEEVTYLLSAYYLQYILIGAYMDSKKNVDDDGIYRFTCTHGGIVIDG